MSAPESASAFPPLVAAVLVMTKSSVQWQPSERLHTQLWAERMHVERSALQKEHQNTLFQTQPGDQQRRSTDLRIDAVGPYEHASTGSPAQGRAAVESGTLNIALFGHSGWSHAPSNIGFRLPMIVLVVA